MKILPSQGVFYYQLQEIMAMNVSWNHRICHKVYIDAIDMKDLATQLPVGYLQEPGDNRYPAIMTPLPVSLAH